jgi:cytochrome c oxidase subunit 4
MKTHIVPVKTYVWVLLALLALTVATTEIAKVDLGVFNPVVALLIAGSKTMLVVLFFMHMKWSGYRTHVVAAGGLLWLAIMIAFVLSDYLTRAWLPQPMGW